MTAPSTRLPHQGRLRRSDRRDAAINRRALRIVLVVDHPAQQFARALQLLADEPGVQLHVYYWSTPETSYDARLRPAGLLGHRPA